ncbi:MAG: hydroxyphenylacetyl-CoA thioesterase PaaI [Acidimicrobiia bacterium]
MPEPRDVAAALLARDHASRSLGMELVDVGAGAAKVRMVVRSDMVNGHGVCHGGLIFTLADSALAFACNGGNVNTLAAAASIEFVRPARLGTELVATASAVHQRGRTGHYDVVVTGDDDELIALFRARTRATGGAVLDEATVEGDTVDAP